MKTFFHSKWIQIQQSVTIVNLETQLLIKGPLGASFLKFPKKLVFEKNNIQGYRFFGCSEQKNLVLTYYSLLINAIKGVYLGYSEILIINGVGWRISIQDKVLIFSLGFSHSIFYTLKNDIEVILYDKQCFKIFGLNSQFVQQVVADLCRLRLFNVYKGKGVYKQGEVFSLKESSKSKA